MHKTNAARLLDEMGIAYELRTYAVDERDLSAESVAAKVGLAEAQVLKTLAVSVTGAEAVRGHAAIKHALACVPAGTELDLKALAAALAAKRVELLPLRDVLPVTGYVRGGVSPLGTKKRLRTMIDASARQHAVVSISAGERGTQLLVAPEALARACDASFAAIARSLAS
jgi:Cys-tRNA(Pro)/Cys-tRNA(Cys) deacylase